jgi:hypothetical protein
MLSLSPIVNVGLFTNLGCPYKGFGVSTTTGARLFSIYARFCSSMLLILSLYSKNFFLRSRTL